MSKRTPPIGRSSPLKPAPAKSTGSLTTSQQSIDPSVRSVPSGILRKTKSSRPMSKIGTSTKSLISSDDGRSTASNGKKRSRSSSRSESPPPAKKRATSTDYRDEIWQILGRNRAAYVSMDVFSDEEDMEADATILEKEEQQRFKFSFILVMLSLTLCILQRSHCQERGRACLRGGETSRGRKTQTEGEGERSAKKRVIDASITNYPCYIRYMKALPPRMSGLVP